MVEESAVALGWVETNQVGMVVGLVVVVKERG